MLLALFHFPRFICLQFHLALPYFPSTFLVYKFASIQLITYMLIATINIYFIFNLKFYLSWTFPHFLSSLKFSLSFEFFSIFKFFLLVFVCILLLFLYLIYPNLINKFYRCQEIIFYFCYQLFFRGVLQINSNFDTFYLVLGFDFLFVHLSILCIFLTIFSCIFQSVFPARLSISLYF